MVSASEGLIYYCTVFLTALVFLTEASAITTNYEKSNTQQNKTQETQTLPSHQRTKSTPTRNRTNLSSKHHNADRVNPILLTKLKSNAKIESGPRTAERQINETLLSSSSGGENEIKDKGGGSSADDDDQKTLFQQVADGKYGLIQNELFASKPERPGVISYDANPEVPKDNINNLGGLESEDIWLAENHLLVLAGSRLNGNPWIPIDDYAAPKRPVKIPPNPKIPPPFPVQLSENGPIEYIGSSAAKRPEPSIGIFNPIHFPYANFNASPPNHVSTLYGKVPYGSAGNPLSTRGHIKSPPLPPPLPVNIKPSIGAEFIPPYLRITNQSEIIDEDDPSLYYPPPYDFYYPKDNTSKVPAGPLVPGIVMPPPPNFFSSFDNTTTNSKSKLAVEQVRLKDKPYKGNAYKIGKQLHYVNSTTTAPAPASSTEQTRPSWHPNDFAIYNEIINDQTFPKNDALARPNIKDEEANNQMNWIPIPAPTPLYITGPKKPIKNTVLVMTDTLKSPGYSYDRPENALSIPERQQRVKFVQPPSQENSYPSTTPFIYPQIMSTQSSLLQNVIPSTTPISPHQQSPTIKATYYFYEEPKFAGPDESVNSLYTNTDSPSTTIDTLSKYREPLPNIHSDDASTSKYDEKKRKPNAPLIPIYYLAELDNAVDFIKPVDRPDSTHVPKSEYYTTTAKPTYTINKPHYEQPTPKPIFEYSYVASNYKNPASSTGDSTLGPLQPSNFNSAPSVSNYPFDFNDFYGPQRQQQQQQPQPPVKFPSIPPHYSVFQVPVHTTATPILFFDHIKQYAQPAKVQQYNFERPWISNLQLYNDDGYAAAYPTENPYYAFFTKEDADLIDENTKKYFTIFGQKIKHGVESTSPLPVVQTIAAPELGASRWNTKYRTYKKYPSQSSKNIYSVYSTTTVPYKSSTSTDHAESQILSTAINKPARYHPVSGNRIIEITSLPPHINANDDFIPSKLSKHIRPIVVQDLPADLNERLKNIAYTQNRGTKFFDGRPNTSHSQFRYTLIDNVAYDNQPYRYSQFVLNKNQRGFREPSYSEHRPSTPVSLHDDVRVNDFKRGQKQSEDPDAEYVRNSSNNVGTVRKDNGDDLHDEAEELSTPKLISLENDVLVNYKKPHPSINPDAEYIPQNVRHQSRPSRPRAYWNRNNGHSASYSSPHVERDHFYFLTPSETRLTQIEDERYDSQSNVEKPSAYIKRVIEKPKTTKTAS